MKDEKRNEFVWTTQLLFVFCFADPIMSWKAMTILKQQDCHFSPEFGKVSGKSIISGADVISIPILHANQSAPKC